MTYRWRRLARFLGTHPSRRRGLNWLLWSAVLVLVIVVAGVAGSTPRTEPAAGSATTTPVTPGNTSAAAAQSTEASVTAAVPSSHQPSTTSRAVPAPAPGTGGEDVTAAGVILPNPRRTPGAVNPAVTQATIGSTICVSGWTATIRPPSSYTTGLKEQQLATGYAYHGDTSTGDYEEDHLISLELGGSPTSELNLWPEPYAATDGAHLKDRVENRLHTLVCDGEISLAAAQRAIASNWYTAYQTYVGTPGTPVAASTAPAPAPPRTSTPAAAPALGCSASMSDPSPAQYSKTDVLVRTGAGAAVTATAHYKTTDTTHTGTADGSGRADLAFYISRATVGRPVDVSVSVSADGATATCGTSFTPVSG